jgi:hypothetical protein
VALNQNWVCAPELGCGQVAGYGPSRTARRPQYDWFFDDGLIAVRAYLADGQYERARQELEFVAHSQNRDTGMIWHEISLSAGSLDWARLPYFFAHVDSSLAYLSTAANYVSTTGDRRFLQTYWTSFRAAYRYCLTVIDAQDGLPRIPRGKLGDNEQDEDRGDSLNLANEWIEASTAFASLAAAAGHAGEAHDAAQRVEQAKRSLVQRYWDGEHHSWIRAHARTGPPSGAGELLPATVLSHVVVTAQQRDALLDEIASSDFQTDWGIRSKAANARTYDPNLYSSGSVWALGTSDSAVGLWAQHRPITAMSAWYGLVSWSSLDSLGHLHEVLAGDLYHEETESVPEQMWSSADFFWAASRGLLGLSVDGGAHRLTLAPHLPAQWEFVRVLHQRVGDSSLSFELRQNIDGMQLELQNDGPEVHVVFDPEIPFGASNPSAQLGNRSLPTTLEQNPQDTHAQVEFSLAHGHSTLTLQFSGGVALYPPLTSPEIGSPTQGLKITDVGLGDRRLTIELERASPEFSSFMLRTMWKLGESQGARAEGIAPNLYQVTLTPPEDSQDSRAYQRIKVVLQLSDDSPSAENRPGDVSH